MKPPSPSAASFRLRTHLRAGEVLPMPSAPQPGRLTADIDQHKSHIGRFPDVKLKLPPVMTP